MTANRDLNRLRAETAVLALALLAVLDPEQRTTALKILQLGDELGGTTNGVLVMLKDMMTVPEGKLQEFDHA